MSNPDVVSDHETEAPPGSLWSRMKADPQYAPEHMALEAVRKLGPEAAVWAERMRVNQPDLTPDALAELAVQRFTTLARISGAVSGGCVEGAVVEVAEEILSGGQPRLLHFGIADEEAWDVGLPCGGEISVWVERYEP